MFKEIDEVLGIKGIKYFTLKFEVPITADGKTVEALEHLKTCVDKRFMNTYNDFKNWVLNCGCGKVYITDKVFYDLIFQNFKHLKITIE